MLLCGLSVAAVSGGYSLIVALGFLAVWFPCCIAQALEHMGSCGRRARLLCGMWNFPGLGIEFVSPALAGGFLNHWSTMEVLIYLFDERTWSCPGPTCIITQV